jgi:hypothetical protein
MVSCEDLVDQNSCHVDRLKRVDCHHILNITILSLFEKSQGTEGKHSSVEEEHSDVDIGNFSANDVTVILNRED